MINTSVIQYLELQIKEIATDKPCKKMPHQVTCAFVGMELSTAH